MFPGHFQMEPVEKFLEMIPVVEEVVVVFVDEIVNNLLIDVAWVYYEE